MSSSRILKGDKKHSSVTPYTIREMESKTKPGKREEASKDAETIIRNAREIKESIEMEAYKEGILKGQEEGRKMAIKQIEPLFDTLKNALKELSDLRSAMIEKHHEQILEIVFLIAEKAIHRQIHLSPDIILDTVRAASSHLTETEEIRIRLHPSDFEYIKEIEAIISKKLTGGNTIHVIEDSSIDRGGSVIETEFGDIDATVRSQIEHMKEVVIDHD